MELIWIRHFQTPGNGRKEYIGRTDEPLNEEKIPDPMYDYGKVDALCVSPMKRCRQTAGLLFAGQEQIVYENLRELDFGDFEQKNYLDLDGNPEYQKWIDAGGKGAFPGGEEPADFLARCVAETERMLSDLLERQVRRAGVVVHGGTIMSVMSAFTGDPRSYFDWMVDNGKGYSVTIDEEEWKSGTHRFYDARPL